jgi:antitoxin VapB
MEPSKFAKLFRNGRSQAVRLPKEFRFPGKQVRVRRVATGVLLEPASCDVNEWFALMDRWTKEPFLITGRKQPKPQKRKFFR